MNIPLFLYRLTGWLVTGINLILAFYVMRSKAMWQGKYRFLAIHLIFLAVVNIISMISALFKTNNLFLEHILTPVGFVCKALFLSSFHNKKTIRNWVWIIIVIFVSINLFNTFNKHGYKFVNTIPLVINRVYFLFFSIWNLSILFKSTLNFDKLRQNPDFWFTATILSFSFLGFIWAIIIEVSYKAGSDLVLYSIFISENLLNSFVYFGYFYGILRLNRKS